MGSDPVQFSTSLTNYHYMDVCDITEADLTLDFRLVIALWSFNIGVSETHSLLVLHFNIDTSV